MRRSGFRLLAATAALALLAAACGKDRDNADDSTTTAAPATTAAPVTTAAPETTAAVTPDSADTVPSDTGTGDTETPTSESEEETTTTEAVPDVPMFGDAPWPCGPGDGANTDSGDEVGVTVDSITIATGDDAGYAGSPGLNSEITDTMEAIVAACNELGGINGRQINLNYYDAKVFEVGPAIQAACDEGNFFLVGEGWAFDVNQEEIRLGCGLPAVPTYATSAAFAHGKDVFASIPNPSDETSAGYFALMAEHFPDETTGVAALVGAFAATQESRDRAITASEQFGWTWASKTIEYNPVGEADWTPFVRELVDANAKLVYWSGSCLPSLQLFMQTASANGLDVPVLTDANHYARICAEANTDGALDNLYVRVATVPFEEADVSPATQQYLDLMAESGGGIAVLGVQTASSFLLWATAASQCGAELTRACALENLKNTHSWTGHGLHVETDPGGNRAPRCVAVLHLQGTEYVRLLPEERGTFACDDAWVADVSTTAAAVNALLDENRISQQFSTG